MTPHFDLRAADGAQARIHLQGAHLASWKPAGNRDSALFLSADSAYAPGFAIRGGVPLIFPQFASEGALPKHGFARTAPWSLQDTRQLDEGGASARLRWQDDETTRALWPHAFAAGLEVRIGGAQLQLQLDIRNTGTSEFQFTAALHTYLRIDALAAARVHGLQGLRYRDTAAGGTPGIEAASALAIVGETDRLYFDTPATLRVEDTGRRIELHQQGFCDTVIWNPGAERAAGLSDLEPDGWQRMLCVEAAVVGRPVRLAPGASWRGGQALVEIRS